MENKDLIFLDTGIEESYVLVERNKKRQAEKTKRILKRAVVFILLIGLIFGAIKLIPGVLDALNSKKPSNNTPISGGETDSDTQSIETNQKESDTEGENNSQNNSNSGTPPAESNNDSDYNGGISKPADSNKDTSTDLDTENNENESEGNEESTDSETDTSVSLPDMNEGTNTDTNVDNEDTYKINEIGPTKYTAINESGCEFDFSVKYSKASISDIKKRYGSDSPIILITHSQKNEAYSNGKGYSEDDAFYSDEKNVASLGKIICDRLNAYGIPAIQLSEIYGSGGIYGSKKEYEKALSDTLKRYPSIAYVFNISRGIKINNDMSMNKSYFENGGEKLAQISLISGSGWDKASSNQIDNVRFAFDLSKFLNVETNGFVKNNTISKFPLSQNFTPSIVNLEIGEYANSYDEAKRSAELFSTLLYKYLKN